VYAWDAINTEWNRWVVGFNQDRQQSIFDGFGIPKIDWQTLAIYLIVGVFIAGGSVGLFLLLIEYRNRKPPVIAAFERFCAQMARQGLIRQPHEGPADFLARIKAAQPANYQQAKIVIDAYIHTRYAPTSTLNVAEFLRVVKAFRVNR
jgi:protein-glutamine gamma-glutamyltransferase